MDRTDDALFRRLFGVAVEPQTYRNVVYLLLAFPLGTLYFAAIVAGGAAGVGTLPILVGIPILASVLVFAVHLAALESRLADGLLGTDVDYETVQPDGETVVPYVKRLALDPKTYLAIGYLLSKFAIGIAAFTAVVTLAALSVSFAFAPLLYDLPGVAYQVGPWEIDTLARAVGLSVVGVAVAFPALHLLNVFAWVVGAYTEAMLGSARSDVDGPGGGSSGDAAAVPPSDTGEPAPGDDR